MALLPPGEMNPQIGPQRKNVKRRTAMKPTVTADYLAAFRRDLLAAGVPDEVARDVLVAVTKVVLDFDGGLTVRSPQT